MASILALVAIQLATTIALRLITPKQKRAKPAEFDPPKAEEGAALPVIFGCAQMPLNLMYVATQGTHEGDEFGEIYYNAELAGSLGWGPLDVIYDLIGDEQSLALQPQSRRQNGSTDPNPTVSPTFPYEFGASSDPAIFAVAARLIFGGNKEEGGWEGEFRVYRGVTDQPIDRLTEFVLDERASRYPHLAYVVFGAEPGADTTSYMSEKWRWSVNSPTPKAVSVLAGRYPRALLPSEDGRIGLGCNPIEAIYDIMTNPRWGKKFATTRFDTPQLEGVAQTMIDENLGLCIIVDSHKDADDVIDDILMHIRAERVQDPITGLFQIKLLRADYEFEDLLELNDTNTREFHKIGTTYASTTNHLTLKYRSLEGGRAGIVVDQPVSGWTTVLGNAFWDSGARNLTEVSARADATPLVLGDDFHYDNVRGMFVFNLSEIDDEADVFVSYTSNPTFRGFVDASVTSQNNAHRQITGRHNPEAVDYPMFYDRVTAQHMADILMQIGSRDLPNFKWEMNRVGFNLTRGDVVLHDGMAIRITKAEPGPPDDPWIQMEGIEDIFGEESAASIPLPSVEDPEDPTQDDSIPPIAAIFCIDEDLIGVQASDETFNIEVQQADDTAGTGAVMITPDGGVVGTTDEFSIVVGKVHRARHVRGLFFGAWTNWLDVCPVGEDPGCVIPTWEAIPNYETGDLTFLVIDPQNRLVSVEFYTRPGMSAPSSWEVATGTQTESNWNFETSVELVDNLDSAIGWRVTYFDCDGLEQQATGEVIFPADPPSAEPPIDTGLSEVPIEIVLFGADDTERFSGFGAGVAPMMGNNAHQTHFDLAPFNSARIVRVMESSDLPIGARAGAQFEIPEIPGEWRFLDLADGPFIAVDTAAVAETPSQAERGEYKSIAIEAKRDVRIRGVWIDGDGDEAKFIVGPRIVLQLTPTQFDAEPPETTEPPIPPDPGSCLAATLIDMDTGWVGGDDTGAVWSNMSNTSARITIDGTGSGPNYWEITLTGLTPSVQHTYYLTAETGALPVGAFLEAVGGDIAVVDEVDTPVSLVARVTSSAGGEVTLRFGVQELEGEGGGGGGSGSDDLSYANSGAASVAGWVESGDGTVLFNTGVDVGPFGTSIKITGTGAVPKKFARNLNLVPGGTFRFRVWATTQGIGPWWTETSITAVSGANLSSDQINGSEPEQQLTTPPILVDASGDVEISFSARAFFGDMPTWLAGLTWEQIAGPVGDPVVVDFSNLGFCEGSGLPEEDPEGEEPDIDPPPPPPPGGFPPPPVGGARPFTAHNTGVEGTAYWNGTVIVLTRTRARNILLQAETAETFMMPRFGPEDRWLDSSGRFQYDLWNDVITEFWEDLELRTLYNQAATATGPFTGRRVFFHYLLDEPNRSDERYGGSIPFATVERMALRSKELFENVPTLLRIDPLKDWYVRKMSGLDCLWAEYLIPRGPVEEYRRLRLEACADFEQQLVFGIHYKHFHGIPPNGPHPGYITAAELRHYGRILATPVSPYPPSVAMGGWRHETGLVSQPGFLTELRDLRDYYASLDP